MEILQKFYDLNSEGKRLRIGVLGDAMIDEYFNLRAKKISPEYPIPVMHSDEENSILLPGGAANVVYQFINFNVDAKLIAFTDQEAKKHLVDNGLDCGLCLNIKNPIPRKKRFYSDNVLTYRWDVEQKNNGLQDLDKKCKQLYKKAESETFDVLILSDYDKGVFQSDPSRLIEKSRITIVDPKTQDIEKWFGCTIFKPNEKEALALSGKTTIEQAGKYLLDILNCQAVVITQAENGVSVFDKDGVYKIYPKRLSSIVESVIGAGDAYMAFLAMAVGRGMTIREAAEVAWYAGSLYVRNRYNKPLSPCDLAGVFDPRYQKLDCAAEIFGDRNYKLAFTNGCFDILHVGHVESLKFAKQQGDKLVVAINSDESVSRLKPGRPFVPLRERMSMVAALEFVDYVVSFEEETPFELIKKIKPDVIVKGSEYRKEDIAGHEIAEIVTCPMMAGLSTTNIIEKIKASSHVIHEKKNKQGGKKAL